MGFDYVINEMTITQTPEVAEVNSRHIKGFIIMGAVRSSDVELEYQHLDFSNSIYTDEDKVRKVVDKLNGSNDNCYECFVYIPVEFYVFE